MIRLSLRCPKHPRYMGKLPPRVTDCTGCDCQGIWTIAQWARGADHPDSARESVVRVHRMLLQTWDAIERSAFDP